MTPYFIDRVVLHASRLVAATIAAHGAYASLEHLPKLFEAELYRELRKHGLAWHTIADLVDLSPSTVVERAQSLEDAASYLGRFNYWAEIVDYIFEKGGATRPDIGRRFYEVPSNVVAEILRLLKRMEVLAEAGDRRRPRLIINPKLAEQGKAMIDDQILMAALNNIHGATRTALTEWLGIKNDEPAIARIDASLSRLTSMDGIEGQGVRAHERQDGETVYSRRDWSGIPDGNELRGLLAAMDHHLESVHRLMSHVATTGISERRGWGSAYVFYIRPGNPLESKVRSQLDAIRDEMSSLRGQTEQANEGLPAEGAKRIVFHMGAA